MKIADGMDVDVVFVFVCVYGFAARAYHMTPRVSVRIDIESSVNAVAYSWFQQTQCYCKCNNVLDIILTEKPFAT